MSKVIVSEVFYSIQGESSYAGRSCYFIRLSGCNLRCRYCDTDASFNGGEERSVDSLVEQALSSNARMVAITGGEPLIQPSFKVLASKLLDGMGPPVVVETNGTCDISVVPDGVVSVMDIKCPGSGCGNCVDMKNIERLRTYDEVKFVLSDRHDYDWAADFLLENYLASRCNSVFFTPVWGELDLKDLCRWILEDDLPVTMGIQMHKVIGVK